METLIKNLIKKYIYIYESTDDYITMILAIVNRLMLKQSDNNWWLLRWLGKGWQINGIYEIIAFFHARKYSMLLIKNVKKKSSVSIKMCYSSMCISTNKTPIESTITECVT